MSKELNNKTQNIIKWFEEKLLRNNNEHAKTILKLKIAVNALKKYARPEMWEMDGFSYMDAETAKNALKEIEVLK